MLVAGYKPINKILLLIKENNIVWKIRLQVDMILFILVELTWTN